MHAAAAPRAGGAAVCPLSVVAHVVRPRTVAGAGSQHLQAFILTTWGDAGRSGIGPGAKDSWENATGVPGLGLVLVVALAQIRAREFD